MYVWFEDRRLGFSASHRVCRGAFISTPIYMVCRAISCCNPILMVLYFLNGFPDFHSTKSRCVTSAMVDFHFITSPDPMVKPQNPNIVFPSLPSGLFFRIAINKNNPFPRDRAKGLDGYLVKRKRTPLLVYYLVDGFHRWIGRGLFSTYLSPFFR
jgi:hypothetical protein